MKKILLLPLLFIGFYAFAQSANQVAGVFVTHYVFDKFYPGKVYLKSGEVSERSLNYNALTHEMIFEDAGKYLAIAKPETVDSVIIAGRKFIAGDKKFYEWIAGKNYPLFADYVSNLLDEGVNTGYGNSSTASSHSLKTIIGSGMVYALKLPDEYKVNSKVVYYLYKDNEYHKINNAKQLSNLYPAKKTVINEWVKANHTDFSKRDDLARLITQLDTQAGDN
jgi:hypothetical protein